MTFNITLKLDKTFNYDLIALAENECRKIFEKDTNGFQVCIDKIIIYPNNEIFITLYRKRILK